LSSITIELPSDLELNAELKVYRDIAELVKDVARKVSYHGGVWFYGNEDDEDEFDWG